MEERSCERSKHEEKVWRLGWEVALPDSRSQAGGGETGGPFEGGIAGPFGVGTNGPFKVGTSGPFQWNTERSLE